MTSAANRRSALSIRWIFRSCATLALIGLFATSSPTLFTYEGEQTSRAAPSEDANPDEGPPVDEKTSALIAAINEGRLDKVEQLLARGADVNATIPFEGGQMVFTPLLLAAGQPGRVEIVRALLRAGADISAQEKLLGGDALYSAASSSDVETVELLLENGAEIDSRDWMGTTPLMRAVLSGHVETMKLLIERGANVNARIDKTRHAYRKAQFVGDTATIREIERSGRLPFRFEDGASVLDYAQGVQNRQAIKLLLAAGAKP